MMTFVWAALLVVAVLLAWVLQIFGLFGNWIIVMVVALYSLTSAGEGSRLAIDWPIILALAVLATLGEVVELVAGAWGVARKGGSRRGAVLALVGSLVGALAGAFVGLPIPIVGSVVAAILFAGLGALAGAMLGESWKGRSFDDSVEIGKAAFWGRLFGTLGKVLVGAVMVAVAVAALVL